MLISTLDSGYLAALSNYHRALSQRNHALKSPERAAVAAAFEPELAAHAPLIAARRREYAAAVEQEVNRMLLQRGRHSSGFTSAAITRSPPRSISRFWSGTGSAK